MAVVFLLAAALLLPPELVALMGLAQHLPDIAGRRFPPYITAFNVSNYTLSTLAAWGAARLIGTTGLEADLRWASAGVAAAVVLVVVNHAALAVMLRLARGRSFRSTGLLAPSALLADLALASLGVVLARFYLSNPYLIPLAVAPLVLIQRSFTLLARLGESEERFRAMFEGAPTGTIMVDLDERIVSSNRAFEELVGYGKPDLAGRRLADLGRPADLEADPLSRLLAGERERYVGQLRLLRRDGSDVWGQVAASLVVDAQRRPRFAIVMVEDLTERVRLEEQLRHSQRMEAVGQLAGGVAHDFNNLLTIIAGRTRFALRALRADAGPIRSDLEEIAGAAARAAELTHQLLAYSRRQVLQPRVLDLNAVVTEMDRMLRRLIGEHIEIELDLAADLGAVRADRGQLEQVIANLAVNARDAMEGGGRLTIETGNVVLDDSYPGMNSDVTAGNYVMLAVTDSGHGIPADILNNVFEPFFTTKDVDKGSGLGLSMVYGFVKQSHGHIKIYSEQDYGTTVRIYLPQATGAAQSAGLANPSSIEGGDETILIVEDDGLVRAFVISQIQSLGYRTLAAIHAAEALVFIDGPEKIDLLFTDMIMPGSMNGRQLADEALRRRPALKILFTSGYSNEAIIHHGHLDDGVLLLAKPYRKSDLARMIRSALAADVTLDPPTPEGIVKRAAKSSSKAA